MRIIVNHVTRMRTDSRICVAGLGLDDLTHVRPVTPASDPLTRRLLRSEGGAFGPGALVDIGDARSGGSAPETEDYWISSRSVRRVEDLDDDTYLHVLDLAAAADIQAAFGPDLEEVRPRKFAVPEHHGIRSLAVVKPRSVELNEAFGNLYATIGDGSLTAKVGVTDVRFHEPDHKTLRSTLVADVRRRIAAGVDVYAMLGLARAMNDDDAGPVHWLMCNGLCLADRAVSDRP